jgi:hypothetical protein
MLFSQMRKKFCIPDPARSFLHKKINKILKLWPVWHFLRTWAWNQNLAAGLIKNVATGNDLQNWNIFFWLSGSGSGSPRELMRLRNITFIDPNQDTRNCATKIFVT